ncbi:MAG TPA: histidine phosphatase family protein [Clostridiales bacterium]|nr:histidine phosphatase family protein [Clostridiales bacterium]
MVTRLILVRHAEAEGNINRVFHGWTDSEITEKGHAQAKLIAQYLRDTDIDVLYSSSLKRTLQTAEYIAKAKGLPIIRTDKLKEINGGNWEDVAWDILPKKWPQEYYSWENEPHAHKMPGGESMKEFQRRLIEELKYIISSNKGNNICIVTHGTAIRSLMCYFHHCDLEEMVGFPWVDNTSFTIVDYEDDKDDKDNKDCEGGQFTVITEGNTSHLSQEMKTLGNQEWWQKNIKDKKGVSAYE